MPTPNTGPLAGSGHGVRDAFPGPLPSEARSGGQLEALVEPAGEGVEARSVGARNATLVLVGVLAVFVLLGTLIAVKTPAYESADEPGHVENIETLVSGHWYGMNSDCKYSPREPLLLGCAGDEAHQAPLYYLVLAGWQRLVALPPELLLGDRSLPLPSSAEDLCINGVCSPTTALPISGFCSGCGFPMCSWGH